MPSCNRKPIQIPKRLHARLLAERDRLDREYAVGNNVELPDFGHDQGIPLWYVIERVLDFKERHRQRSRNGKRRGERS